MQTTVPTVILFINSLDWKAWLQFLKNKRHIAGSRSLHKILERQQIQQNILNHDHSGPQSRLYIRDECFFISHVHCDNDFFLNNQFIFIYNVHFFNINNIFCKNISFSLRNRHHGRVKCNLLFSSFISIKHTVKP